LNSILYFFLVVRYDSPSLAVLWLFWPFSLSGRLQSLASVHNHLPQLPPCRPGDLALMRVTLRFVLMIGVWLRPFSDVQFDCIRRSLFICV
jgi:hypothetical protein